MPEEQRTQGIKYLLNLNFLFNHIEFVSILDNSRFTLNCLGPLCHHLNWLQIWPPDGATCIDYKFSLQVALLASAAFLAIRWCHLSVENWPPSGVLVQNLVIRWRNLHWFQSWQSVKSAKGLVVCFRHSDPRYTWVR